MKIMTFNSLIRFFVVAIAGVVMFTSPKRVYAYCDNSYGGGDNCDSNKSFDISKKVRKQGDTEWKDKITDVKKGDKIEFRIRIKNVGDVETDGMKMKDSLPDELKKISGSGLTEYFDNFGPGEKEDFYITVTVEDKEFDRKDFDKCVVNKASVYLDTKFEKSDTATVCYSDSKLKELPKTGSESAVIATVAGFGLTALGLLIKKSRN